MALLSLIIYTAAAPLLRVSHLALLSLIIYTAAAPLLRVSRLVLLSLIIPVYTAAAPLLRVSRLALLSLIIYIATAPLLRVSHLALDFSVFEKFLHFAPRCPHNSRVSFLCTPMLSRVSLISPSVPRCPHNSRVSFLCTPMLSRVSPISPFLDGSVLSWPHSVTGYSSSELYSIRGYIPVSCMFLFIPFCSRVSLVVIFVPYITIPYHPSNAR